MVVTTGGGAIATTAAATAIGIAFRAGFVVESCARLWALNTGRRQYILT
jgi:hypothetical protein